MEFKVVKPSPSLEKYVYSYLLIQNSEFPLSQKVFHGGYSAIAFHLEGNNYKIKEFGDSNVFHPAKAIIGQVTNFYTISTYGVTNVFLIIFKPSGIYRLFNYSISSITNSDADLEEVIGSRAEEVYQKLLINREESKRIEVINDFLEQHIRNDNIDDPVEYALEIINRNNGNISIQEILKDLSVSDRTLQRRFKEIVGITPKQYSKIIRFNYLLKMIRKGGVRNWIEISYLGGYYDQMHFIKDVKAFTGLTPRFIRNSESISLFDPHENDSSLPVMFYDF